jgi:hypothetical protein
LLTTVFLMSGEANANEGKASAKTAGDRVMAIDVLLLPDATMNKKAEAANARLRGNYPQGYPLGRAQVPHITLVQEYVRQNDLPAIESAVTKLVEKARPLKWKLTAVGYNSGAWGDVTITTIRVAPDHALMQLHSDVLDAIEKYQVKGGTASAFSVNTDLPNVGNEIVQYVENFSRRSSNKFYDPHVTIGVGREDFVNKLKAEPLEKFTFQPAGAAIYQLGKFGTAQKKLWEWNPRPSAKK